MNTPEKITNLYTRLNGFLVLPHFTIFDGKCHTHVDFVGIKPGKGREVCNSRSLPIDEDLFKVFDSMIEKSLETTFGLVGEIKGNKTIEIPKMEHLKYVRHFLGDIPTIGFSISEGKGAPKAKDATTVIVGVEHVIKWIKERISWMERELELSKSASWSWSEEYMGDLLYLIKVEE